MALAAAGKGKLLAVASPARSRLMPQVPTVAEAGVPGYEVLSWNGFFGPAGLPKEVIETVNKAMREILAEDTMKKRLASLGVEANASSPEELKKRMVDDIKKWGDVIERAHIPKQ
jgi:tripartite-type tricarboxylate transporter receptor subunit TctC